MLQDFLDEWMAQNPGEIDYIHGDEEGLRSVASILRIKGVYQVMARAVLTHRERCIYYHIFLK